MKDVKARVAELYVDGLPTGRTRSLLFGALHYDCEPLALTFGSHGTSVLVTLDDHGWVYRETLLSGDRP